MKNWRFLPIISLKLRNCIFDWFWYTIVAMASALIHFIFKFNYFYFDLIVRHFVGGDFIVRLYSWLDTVCDFHSLSMRHFVSRRHSSLTR